MLITAPPPDGVYVNVGDVCRPDFPRVGVLTYIGKRYGLRVLNYQFFGMRVTVTSSMLLPMYYELAPGETAKVASGRNAKIDTVTNVDGNTAVVHFEFIDRAVAWPWVGWIARLLVGEHADGSEQKITRD